MKVLIDSGLLKYYTHTIFNYQFFNIIAYFKGDKVIIEWTSARSLHFIMDMSQVLALVNPPLKNHLLERIGSWKGFPNDLPNCVKLAISFSRDAIQKHR